jgi:hypothetical protein
MRVFFPVSHTSRRPISLRGRQAAMAHPMILGDQVWCPQCRQYAMLLRTRKAARVADVSCKTVYRYVEEGKVHVVKIAGSTIRICAGCLLRQDDEHSV